MSDPSSPPFRNVLTTLRWIMLASAFLAVILLLFHDVHGQRQHDTQLINYALEFLRSIKNGGIQEFLLTPRKYPLLLPLLLSVPFAAVLGTLSLTGVLRSDADAYAYLYGHPVLLTVTGRLCIAFCALGSLVLVYRLSRKIFPKQSPLSAVTLLLSSMIFLTYTSAVRVHMPAVFMTLLAFFLSLPLFEIKSFRTECIAFLASAAAFAALQSGVFTVIFPVAAFLSSDGRLILKRALMPRLWGWIGVWGIVSIFIGYPFLLSSFLSTGHIGFGLGNEAFDTQTFHVSGFLIWKDLVLGSEVFLLYFFCRSLLTSLLHRKSLSLPVSVLLLYAFVFSLFFGFVEGTASRMYLPVIAVLAIVASEGLEAATIGEWLLFVLCIVAVHLRFAWFASLPNTWQSAHDFLQARTHGTIATDLPIYFLDIPPTRASVKDSKIPRYAWLSGLPEDFPDARPFVLTKDWQQANVVINFLSVPAPAFGAEWQPCASFISGPTGEEMFLWTEMQNALRMLVQGHSLGPSLVVYCRNGAADRN